MCISTNARCHCTRNPRCMGLGFAPGIVLVNEERTLLGRTKLQRNPDMDRLATLMAKEALKEGFGTEAIIMQRKELQGILGRMHVGQVICTGESTSSIIQECMAYDTESRAAILSLHYKEYGMGTSKSPDGEIIMVQLFRG